MHILSDHLHLGKYMYVHVQLYYVRVQFTNNTPLYSSRDWRWGRRGGSLSSQSGGGGLSSQSGGGGLSSQSDGGGLSSQSDGGGLSSQSDGGGLSSQSSGGLSSQSGGGLPRSSYIASRGSGERLNWCSLCWSAINDWGECLKRSSLRRSGSSASCDG